MRSTRGSCSLELDGTVARRHQLVESAHREAEMVHARAAHGVVLGDEEDELVPVHARQDQALAVEGHHRHLVEAEDLPQKRQMSARFVSSSSSGGTLSATWLKRGLPDG